MIVSCNQRCKLSGGTTEASLDLDENKAFCLKCHEEIVNISQFTKDAMKYNKDIIKKTKTKAFSFKCRSCHNVVETEIINGSPYGKDCKTKNCMIQISDIMVNAIEKTKPMNVSIEDDANNDESSS